MSATSDREFERIWRVADEAARAAVAASSPTPMVVEQRANVLDDTSPVLKSWYVEGGMCGFAYIRSKGNTPFGRWFKRAKGATKWYPGGLAISIHDFGQSYERKDTYARTFVRTLAAHGIEDVWMESRLD